MGLTPNDQDPTESPRKRKEPSLQHQPRQIHRSKTNKHARLKHFPSPPLLTYLSTPRSISHHLPSAPRKLERQQRQLMPHEPRGARARHGVDLLELGGAELFLRQIQRHAKFAHLFRVHARQPRDLGDQLGLPARVRGHIDGDGRKFLFGVAVELGGGVVVAGDHAGRLGGGEGEAEAVAEAEGEGEEVVAGGAITDQSGKVLGVGFVLAARFVAVLSFEDLREFAHGDVRELVGVDGVEW